MARMTPAHWRWEEFCDRLEGPDGLNFQEHEPGSSPTWVCGGGTDKTHARRILAAMGFTPDEIERSCEYFEAHGGFCDCEILFNIACVHDSEEEDAGC